MTGQLTRERFMHNPRRFYTLDGYAFMISSWLECTNGRARKGGDCSGRPGWDEELLASLPAYVKADFPATFSCRSGWSSSVLQLAE